MTNPTVIFPDVEIREFEGRTIIQTSVRVAKEDGSGYYFSMVAESMIGTSNRDWREAMCRFNMMVYMAMVCGNVNERFFTEHSEFNLHMDDSNETERDRMKRIMLKKFGAWK